MNFTFAAEPDPSNGIIRFYFYIPRTENVQFEVFNMKGKRVARINNGWLPSGLHMVLFSTNHLANGIYLIRFCIENESIIQKVTLSTAA